jgi:hypothetical protein
MSMENREIPQTLSRKLAMKLDGNTILVVHQVWKMHHLYSYPGIHPQVPLEQQLLWSMQIQNKVNKRKIRLLDQLNHQMELIPVKA